MVVTLPRSVFFVALGVIAIGIGAWYLLPTSATAEEMARTIVEQCAAHEGDPSTCYESSVPQLYSRLSLEEIFSIIREIRRQDHEYQFCHVLAHKLGELAVADDPARWLDVIPLNPSDGLCSNGFIHGVTVGRFRDDVLSEEQMTGAIPDFARACEPRTDWKPSALDQAICYHGMGHLFMFLTNADYRRSLDACEAIALSPTGDFLRVCREGVFMQTYQPLEPDDFALVELLPEKPSRENYRRVCANFVDDAEEGACLREAWPFFRDEIKGGGATDFCSQQPNENETDACFDTVFSLIGRQSLATPDSAEKACKAVPQEEQEKCFLFVASSILEENRSDGARALSFCERAGTMRGACISSLASRARFVFGDAKERVVFCKLLPEELQHSCK